MPSGTVNIFDNASVSRCSRRARRSTPAARRRSLFTSPTASHTLHAVLYPATATYSTSGSSGRTGIHQLAVQHAFCGLGFQYLAIQLFGDDADGRSIRNSYRHGDASQAYVASLNTRGPVHSSPFPARDCRPSPPARLRRKAWSFCRARMPGVTSSMLIQTQAQTAGAVPARTARAQEQSCRVGHSAARHARSGRVGMGSAPAPLAQRLSLVALLGLVTTLGTRPAIRSTTTTTTARQSARDSLRHVYRDRHRAVEQRRHRHHQLHHVRN